MHRSGAAPVVGVTVVKLRVDPARMENYRHDWTRTCLPAGRSPWCVRRRLAGTSGVAVASAHGVPVVPGGAGTSLAGGATAVRLCGGGRGTSPHVHAENRRSNDRRRRAGLV